MPFKLGKQLVREAFVRRFANGKALGSYAGLASSPYSSGGIDREWTRIEDFDALAKRVEQVAARTNAAILVAACIIGLAMIIPYYGPQGWDAWIGIVFWLAVTAVAAGSIRTLWRLRK